MFARSPATSAFSTSSSRSGSFTGPPACCTSPAGSYPAPVRSTLPLAVTIARTVIWFFVSVPVLSEQMVVVEPSVSTDESLRTITFRFAIRCVPSESTMVVIAVRPSGTAATASETASSRTSTSSVSFRGCSTKRMVALIDHRDRDHRDAEQLPGPIELFLQRGAGVFRRLQGSSDLADLRGRSRWR